MQITTLALAFSEWGIGRFPLDLIVFLSLVLIFALPAGINRKKIFVEGDAFTTRLKNQKENEKLTLEISKKYQNYRQLSFKREAQQEKVAK